MHADSAIINLGGGNVFHKDYKNSPYSYGLSYTTAA